MCLQDLRIAARCTRRQVVITGTPSGALPLPDVSRARLVWVIQAGAALTIRFNPDETIPWFVPRDTRFSVNQPTDHPVSAESAGDMLRMPMWVIDADGSGTATVFIDEMTIDDYSAVLQPPE